MSKEPKWIIDKTKKKIIHNDNLSKLAKNMQSNATGITSLSEIDDTTLQLICQIKKLKNDPPSPDGPTEIDLAYKLVWGHVLKPDTAISKKELQDINYENNLDCFMEYNKGFSTILPYIFSLIGCIRKHYKKRIVFCGDQQKVTDIYLTK